MSDQFHIGQKNLEICRDVIQSLNVWDFEHLELLLTIDAVLEMPFAPEPVPRKIEGRDQMIAFFKTVAAVWDTANFHDVQVHTIGDDANRLIATYKADTVVKANGLPYKNQYVTLFSMVGHQVSYIGEHYDPIAAIIATGGNVLPLEFPH